MVVLLEEVVAIIVLCLVSPRINTVIDVQGLAIVLHADQQPPTCQEMNHVDCESDDVPEQLVVLLPLLRQVSEEVLQHLGLEVVHAF